MSTLMVSPPGHGPPASHIPLLVPLRLLDPYLPTRKPGYVNYLNPPAATWREGYWGDNYPRLQEVKER